MPIFEAVDGQLRSLRQVQPGPELYETEIEELIWSNIDVFYGSDLFPVGRQVTISSGGRPDVVALDESGRVVVFEVKRSIDRTQLAQCLEYAGWGRTTSLDELSAPYHGGPDAFFADWLEFTGGSTPVIVNPSPVLVLVAQDFDARTGDALDYLTDSGLPVFPVPVSVHENNRQQRLYLIGSDFEEDLELEPDPPRRRVPKKYLFNGQRVTVSHLLEAGFLSPGETIEYRRVREDKVFPATVTPEGRIRTEDGEEFESLSRAASTLAGVGALPGWEVWSAPERGGKLLKVLRAEFLAQSEVEDR